MAANDSESKLRRVGYVIWVAVRLPIALYLIWFNINLWTLDPADHHPGAGVPANAIASLEFVRHAIENDEAQRMQTFFPEGYFITHAMYGFAWVNVGLRATEPDLRNRAITEASWAEEQLDTPAGRAAFSPDTVPPYGAGYQGWTNWLRGGLLLLQVEDDPALKDRFTNGCELIARAFERHSSPYVETHVGSAWPPDTVFAVATLSLHDALYQPRYQQLVDDWLEDVRRLMVDGMIPHRVALETGEQVVPTRGGSAAMMARMLWEVDPEMGAEQYDVLRRHFADTHLGIMPGVREYRHGTSGPSDVDSGPIFLGFSAASTVLAISAAYVNGDYRLADPMLVGVHAVGIPLGFGDEQYYTFGQLAVGDAILAWAKTTVSWVHRPAEPSNRYDPVVIGGFRFAWHALSLLLLGLLFSTELRRSFHGASSPQPE